MKTALQTIKKIPIILDAKQIVFDADLKKTLGDKLSADLLKKAERNSRNINVYKIVYASKGNKVVGFIVEPKKGSKLPCVIYNRGGSKDFGMIKLGKLFLEFAEMAQWGYVIIASQYSGNGGSEGIDQMGGDDIYDVLNLRKVIKGYSRADASRIGMYGHSRGGMMTYLSLAKVRWIKAAVVGAAPADEVSAPRFRAGWAEHQKEMYGGSLKERKKRSALYWTDKFSKRTPILLMHGSADWRVNPLDSLRIAEKLYLAKVPFRFVFFEGANHGLTEFEDEEKREIRAWFDRYLKNDRKIDLKPHGR